MEEYIMKNLDQVRESIVFYGAEEVNAVDFITVLVGKTLAEDTYTAISRMTLNEVSNLTKEDLLAFEGIGNVAAERIVAAIGLGQCLKSDRFTSLKRIGSSETAKSTFKYLQGLEQEHVDVAYLDTKNQIISLRNIFKGSLNTSVAHPREIFKHAVKLSAARIIVSHNHPSGDNEPSEADFSFTRRLMDAGDMLGIEVVDHIIVGHDIRSLREDGLM